MGKNEKSLDCGIVSSVASENTDHDSGSQPVRLRNHAVDLQWCGLSPRFAGTHTLTGI